MYAMLVTTSCIGCVWKTLKKIDRVKFKMAGERKKVETGLGEETCVVVDVESIVSCSSHAPWTFAVLKKNEQEKRRRLPYLFPRQFLVLLLVLEEKFLGDNR